VHGVIRSTEYSYVYTYMPPYVCSYVSKGEPINKINILFRRGASRLRPPFFSLLCVFVFLFCLWYVWGGVRVCPLKRKRNVDLDMNMNADSNSNLKSGSLGYTRSGRYYCGPKRPSRAGVSVKTYVGQSNCVSKVLSFSASM